MKKRILNLVALLLILLISPTYVFASTEHIDDLNIIFDDYWVVFTRNNIKDEDYLKKYNISYETINTILSDNTYLDAFVLLDANDITNNIELFVMIEDFPLLNINLLKDEDIKMIENEFLNNLKDYKIDKHGTYKSDNTKYIFLEFKNRGYFYKIYYTIINNKCYALKFQSSKAFNDEKYGIIKKVVDDAKFDYDISNEQVIELDDENRFNWNRVITDTISYGTIFAVVGLVGFVIKKKTGRDDIWGS